MLYQVFHFEPPRGLADRLRFTPRAFRTRWPGPDYVPVATVEAATLEGVYRLTNNITTPWSENAGVLPAAPRLRSTSVGDVIVDPEGVAHGVDTGGFARLGVAPVAQE